MPVICVAGAGYVGMSLAVLLSQHNEVRLLEINEERVRLVNSRISPLKDRELTDYLANRKLNLRAMSDAKEAMSGAEFVIVATPTNYDPKLNYFDTSSVECIIDEALEFCPEADIVHRIAEPEAGYQQPSFLPGVPQGGLGSVRQSAPEQNYRGHGKKGDRREVCRAAEGWLS